MTYQNGVRGRDCRSREFRVGNLNFQAIGPNVCSDQLQRGGSIVSHIQVECLLPSIFNCLKVLLVNDDCQVQLITLKCGLSSSFMNLVKKVPDGILLLSGLCLGFPSNGDMYLDISQSRPLYWHIISP
jgi:hypothetical protein